MPKISYKISDHKYPETFEQIKYEKNKHKKMLG